MKSDCTVPLGSKPTFLRWRAVPAFATSVLVALDMSVAFASVDPLIYFDADVAASLVSADDAASFVTPDESGIRTDLEMRMLLASMRPALDIWAAQVGN